MENWKEKISKIRLIKSLKNQKKYIQKSIDVLENKRRYRITYSTFDKMGKIITTGATMQLSEQTQGKAIQRCEAELHRVIPMMDTVVYHKIDEI